MMRQWVCVLHVAAANRPGTAARVSHVFAERGINIEELLAATWEGRPIILLKFAASERLQRYLLLRLARMSEVCAVEVLPAGDRHVWELRDPASRGQDAAGHGGGEDPA